jgi:predicted CoA-binding protein
LVRGTKEILEQTNVIAVVGASRFPEKEAHMVPAEMQDAGFRIIPVNPHAEELFGEKVYRKLEDIPEPVDLVDVFRPSQDSPEVVRSAVRIGAKAVWLQLGVVSEEARRIAKEAGIDYVEDRCLAVERRRLRITKDEAEA